MKKIIWLIVSLLLLQVFSSCTSQESKGKAIALGFKFPVGTEYVYYIYSNQSIDQQMAGMNSKIEQRMELQSTYNVTSAEGQNRKLNINYDRFYIKSSSNGMNVEYDSRDPSKQPEELQSVGKIVNHPFSITVNSKGEITDVQANIDSTNGGSAGQFSDSSIRQMMEQSLNVYPAAPVKPGDIWQRSYTTNVGFMDIQLHSTYKLVSANDSVAHIEVNSTVKSIPSKNPQMKDMHLEMTGTQTGAMDIDIKTGLIKDSQFKQDISGKMKIPGSEIPMTLKSDTRIVGKMR
ncbi:MAG TPA: DUF6263 family protein [Flavipsychrobacter sp.]|nr:DUF6263 family protein [Flavipsychrobacter sp.]